MKPITKLVAIVYKNLYNYIYKFAHIYKGVFIMKEAKKKLIIEIEEALHQEIKMRALLKNINMKAWILRAIADAIKKEDSYNEQ